MKKLVILISGRGSNMEAIVRACSDEGWPAQIAAVIANRPDAAGLAFAASHGIATAV
ncbi:MAG TPA: formyltransferase family protein, partial [Paraburkholderia sp.]